LAIKIAKGNSMEAALLKFFLRKILKELPPKNNIRRSLLRREFFNNL